MMPGFRKPFTFETEYKAIIDYARYTAAITLPDGFTRLAGNSLMIAAKENNVVSGSDKISIWSGDGVAREFALINWKSPGANNDSEVGTLTFSSLGFKGDGSTGAMNSNLNMDSETTQFTQNSGSVSIHVTSDDAAGDGLVFGVRNVAGIAQVTGTIRSATVANNSRIVINDNTTGNFSGSTQTRGPYSFLRTSSTVKSILRGPTSSGSIAVTSVAKPSGDLYIFARNSLSTATVDAFSDARLGYYRVGAVLGTDDRTRWVNAYVDYQHNVQKPYVYATAIRNASGAIVGAPLYEIGVSGWDSGSIFGAAMYKNGGTHFELYGGTTATGDGPTGYEVGAFDLATPTSGTKDAANPLIEIADYPALLSILPMDCLIDGTDVYWFFTGRLDDGNETHDTYIASSTTGAPKTIGSLTSLITAGSTGHYNHGFRIIRDHPDTDYWYATYAFRNTSASNFQINVTRCLRANDITNGANWTVLHTNIVAVPSNVTSNVQPVYPFCWYNSTTSEYHLLYGRFTDEKRQGFTIFWTESSDLSTFPVGKEVVWPTGSLSPTAPDAGYTSLPYMDFDNKLFYYSGRRGFGTSSYITRCVKQFYLRD